MTFVVSGTVCPPLSESSGKPVRYFNGEVQVEAHDFATGGFGLGWGHTRSYSNRMSFDFEYGNGFNWLVRQWPYLEAAGDMVPYPTSSSSSSSSSGPGPMVPRTVVVVRTSHAPLWFDFNGSQYIGRYGVLESPTYDPAHNLLLVTTPLGQVTQFNDFSQTTYPQGLFKALATPGGQSMTVISYSGENIGQVQRSFTSGGVTTTESFLYTYAAGDLQTVLLQRQVGAGAWTNVRQAAYAYYGDNDPNGSPSDLQTATIQIWDSASSSWQDQKVSYYRYWVGPSSSSSSDSSGSPGSSSSSSSSSAGPYVASHLLKFVVDPAAYSRMLAAGITPQTATDAQLAAYADLYLEYDADRHVTKEAVSGGKYVYTFAFFTPSMISSSSSSASSASSASSLERLSLDWGTFTAGAVGSASTTSRLSRLSLEHATVGDGLLESLATTLPLSWIALDGASVSPSACAALGACTRLEYLSLRDTAANDETVASLTGLLKLRELDLAGTRVTDRVLEYLNAFPKLEEVHLARTSLSEAALGEFVPNEQLEINTQD
jgi:hypothetical protein